MKIGDLVRYRHDPASTRTYLVATVDDNDKPKHATLFGWNQSNGVSGSAPQFRVDQLEVISEGR
jgi:hypothetical protein